MKKIIAASLLSMFLLVGCKKNENIPVERIEVSPTSITVSGQGEKLTATIFPSNATDKSVHWKSSNTSVVLVTQDGTLGMVAPGTATVTATTVDGNHSASCSVTVK